MGFLNFFLFLKRGEGIWNQIDSCSVRRTNAVDITPSSHCSIFLSWLSELEWGFHASSGPCRSASAFYKTNTVLFTFPSFPFSFPTFGYFSPISIFIFPSDKLLFLFSYFSCDTSLNPWTKENHRRLFGTTSSTNDIFLVGFCGLEPEVTFDCFPVALRFKGFFPPETFVYKENRKL